MSWPHNNTELQKGYKRKHYLKNKERLIKEAAERKKLRADWFKEYKLTKQCIKCGESHPACLDFNHRIPEEKLYGICEMVCHAQTIENILKEIEKCDILCSNCHRKQHSN
jgi:hypothetical protein